MVWFKGTITEAVLHSKSTSKLFVVFVSGEDDVSKQMQDAWQHADVGNLCSERCVCLKVDPVSDSGRQFSQIYPVVIVPSIYLIGNSGLPIEVIPGNVEAHELAEKLRKALQQNQHAIDTALAGSSVRQPAAAPASSAVEGSPAKVSSQTPVSAAASQDSTTKVTSEDTTKPSIAGPSSAYSDDESSIQDNIKSNIPSEVEKNQQRQQVTYLQEKINEKREERARKEEEEERQREIERRRLGKNVQELRENQEIVKRQKELEQRRKDRDLDKQALERVREQIARDRAERNQRFKDEQRSRNEALAQKKKEQELRKAEQDKSKTELSKVVTIQYRLPNGSAIKREYDRDAKLSEAIADLRCQSFDLPTQFRLGIGIPRRIFEAEDEDRSLVDLDLAPRAALSVYPSYDDSQPRSSGDSIVPANGILNLVRSIVSLPFTILAYLWNSLFGAGAGTNNLSQTPRQSADVRQNTPNNATTHRVGASTSDLRQRTVGSAGGGVRSSSSRSSHVRREGNMHRLTAEDSGSDDDDSATWNGNSTQQM